LEDALLEYVFSGNDENPGTYFSIHASFFSKRVKNVVHVPKLKVNCGIKFFVLYCPKVAHVVTWGEG